MIEIVKPGKKIIYEFICSQCECQYIADTNDVDTLFTSKDKVYSCCCPNCNWGNICTKITYGGDKE